MKEEEEEEGINFFLLLLELKSKYLELCCLNVLSPLMAVSVRRENRINC